MKYEYKMIQVPPNIISSRKTVETAAADYLQNIVNEYAEDGWEFFRIDEFATQEQAGFFSSKTETMRFYKVITFRRELIF